MLLFGGSDERIQQSLSMILVSVGGIGRHAGDFAGGAKGVECGASDNGMFVFNDPEIIQFRFNQFS